ncbi:hypothetical protein B0H17DRAFT_1055194 [Mycena rosella]|uniref:Uncharacterized protein n=1 Tax=Mycena rosella TaxID=1033263 RepID=A0AAD7GKV0_MYCRO|nr:hypothetical protein B0H17DRAFT_1055194 [Mycena rosella]
MSTTRERFPRRLPVDKPPALDGELVDGHRTPTYALAWVCPPRKFLDTTSDRGRPRATTGT